MNIIVTEDTSLGRSLIEMVANQVYRGDIKVVDSSYASSDGKTGGYSLLYGTLCKLVREGQINRKTDTVVVIYDNFLDDFEVLMPIKEALDRDIGKCRSLLCAKGIRHYIARCVCFEEILMSFKYLFPFCDPKGNTENTPERKIIEKAQSKFWSDGGTLNSNASIDYQGLFAEAPPEYSKCTTRESKIKECINKFMGAAKFAPLRIQPNRSFLGHCWEQDCSSLKPTEQCSKCIGRKKHIGGALLKTHEGRLLVLYRYSLLREILKR